MCPSAVSFNPRPANWPGDAQFVGYAMRTLQGWAFAAGGSADARRAIR
jgi:hypothetical protein